MISCTSPLITRSYRSGFCLRIWSSSWGLFLMASIWRRRPSTTAASSGKPPPMPRPGPPCAARGPGPPGEAGAPRTRRSRSYSVRPREARVVLWGAGGERMKIVQEFC